MPTRAQQPSRGKEQAWRNYVRGALASFLNIVITFPMNKVMFRQQAEGHSIREAIRYMRLEGAGNIYRGVIPPLLQKSVSASMMFGLYDQFYCFLLPSLPSPTAHSIAALAAGSCEAILAPFERVQTLLQSRHFNEKVADTRDAFKKLRSYGLKEYYRGASAVLLRNGPSNVLFFGLREPAKQALPKPESVAGNFFNDFLSGAVLGATISTIFYPVNVARIYAQDRIGGPYCNVFSSLREAYRERGSVSQLYRGAFLNASRALVSWGIINASYELFKKIL